ncbi:hypothetical protein ACKTEK_07110 [Tepidamorphus sp. 3E244]|uniref:hypothetical protein n=1 Tax=Tepidamorphus sp. 3E244 TaxID=3385498 RepID=UPI0038FC7F3A
MNSAIPMLASALTTDIKTAVRRTRRNVLIYTVALVALITAYAAAVVGAGIFAAQEWGGLAAAWLIAAIALATAILLVGIVALLNRLEKRKRKVSAGGQRLLALTAISLAPALIRSRSILLIGGALAAGFAANYAMNNHDSTE